MAVRKFIVNEVCYFVTEFVQRLWAAWPFHLYLFSI